METGVAINLCRTEEEKLKFRTNTSIFASLIKETYFPPLFKQITLCSTSLLEDLINR